MVLVSLPLSLDASLSFFEDGGTALSQIMDKVKHHAAHLSEKTSIWTRVLKECICYIICLLLSLERLLTFVDKQHEFCMLHLLRRVIFEPRNFV